MALRCRLSSTTEKSQSRFASAAWIGSPQASCTGHRRYRHPSGKSIRPALAGKHRISVGVVLFQVDVLIWELVQTNRSEKRLRRLDHQDRLRKTVIVEAAPEMNTRFDRYDLEGTAVQPHGLEGKRLEHPNKISAPD